MTDKPELVSTLTGYSECRCILSQYCDGKCRPIYELKPAAHLTIPGALEWDQLPGPVEIEYPEYSEQGMGCGLEDRGITDRYEAMRYGYDEALDQFARILDGYGPLYTHAGTHGVFGTHGADSAHGESDYDNAKEACAEIERAGAPGDVIREMNDELVDLRAQLDESNVVRQLIQAWASVHGRPVPWAKAIEITAVATKMPEDEKAALLALDDEPSSQYTAVDMATAAADGFRDGLAAFSEDGKRNVLAEVFFQKGDDPFICAVRGRVCVEQLESAQRDFRENLPDELEQGDGIYTFDFFYEKGQYDEWGRCEIAPGWGFDFVSYATFDVGDESPVEVKAACSRCGGWGHIETEDSAHDCHECGPSVVERAVEAGVMNAPAEKDPFAATEAPYVPLSAAEVEAFMSMGDGNKAKQKTCIECDQPYCHGVCVERGDQDYDRDQAAKGGCDE